jgi:dipeptidyl aminopeptidase/acylaminoacyl peptidase
VYRNFGGPEVSSTIEVTKHLQNNLAYIDARKTAIWGWSYGGFLSLSVLTKVTFFLPFIIPNAFYQGGQMSL